MNDALTEYLIGVLDVLLGKRDAALARNDQETADWLEPALGFTAQTLRKCLEAQGQLQ